MKFKGTLLNIDGHADSQGEIFTRMAKVAFPKEVKVVHDFDSSRVLGIGKIAKEGKRLTYEIELDITKLPPEVLKNLTPSVCGRIKKRNGKKITDAVIDQISLSISGNADPRIKKLGEQS